MQNSRSRSAPSSSRRTARISAGLIGLMVVGLCALWWTTAMKTPVVVIPNPVMPKTNAFDFYVNAGYKVVNDKQIGDAVAAKPTVFFSPAQKEALVQQNQGAVTTLHQGFAYPYLNPPYRSINAFFPYYAKFRALARLLSLQGQVRAARGDWGGAADSYLDAVRMGEDIPRGSTLIGALVGMACQAIGRKPLWDTVDHLNAVQTRAALARLTHILERRVSFADTVEEEKRTGQALLLEIFRDDKQGKALLTPAGTGGDPGTASAQSLSMLLYLVYSKSRIMQNYTTYADKSAQLARQPYGLHLPPPSPPTDPLNRALAPVFTEARLKDVEIETQNSLLLLTLALHAYRLEHGRYPVSLAALSPAYLKVLPDDPFGVKGTFKYKISGKSYLLYSIGPDGKDDGGTPIDDVSLVGSANPNARYFVNQNSVGDVVAGKNRY